jgi:uncharacterized protein involved in response to NO
VPVWAPFVWAAIGLALALGFGLGALLFAVPFLGWPLGRWWQASAQVHAHEFLFGWAGLMVLGIGFHFLPRLRGRALADPRRARPVLWLLLGGLLLRAASQPALNLGAASGLGSWARPGLILSAALELLGASLALALLARTLGGDPPLRSRPRLGEILPFLAMSFVSLWLALALNLTAIMVAPDDGVLTGPAYRISLLLALYGFLIPVSVGVGARLFPLHFAAPMPATRVLQVGLALLLIGLALRAGGDLTESPVATAVGLMAMACACGCFIVGSRVFAGRRAVPGGRDPWYADAAQWHALLAFACLGVAAILLAAAALPALAPSLIIVPLTAEWHIVGVGFVTLLIFGEATKLLPGFAGRPLRSEALVWTTLVLVAVAVVLRVGPVVAPAAFPGLVGRVALVGSGLAGLVAIIALGLNLSGGPEKQADGTVRKRR